MDRVEDILFKSGFASSTAFEVCEYVDVNLVNDYLYMIVLVLTISIGVKKLMNKEKK
tara:strand:- start:540 stop:710 length:171 start_codon:yes stop_codon:yes gene_type:complete